MNVARFNGGINPVHQERQYQRAMSSTWPPQRLTIAHYEERRQGSEWQIQGKDRIADAMVRGGIIDIPGAFERMKSGQLVTDLNGNEYRWVPAVD